MNMRKFSIFGLAAAAMLTVGCTKDVDTDFVKGNDVVRGELVEMTLVIENSRVGRDAEGSSLGAKVMRLQQFCSTTALILSTPRSMQLM